MAMSMMMGMVMSFSMLSIAGAIGIYLYQNNGISSDYVKAAWEGNKQVRVPDVAQSDTSEDCVYFYNHDTKWTDGDGQNGSISASGQWCIGDGIDRHVPIWETKSQRGEMKHDSVDYVRLGKNLNMTVWDNHNGKSGDEFRGEGKEKLYSGSLSGNGVLLHAKDGVGGDNIDAFKITKA